MAEVRKLNNGDLFIVGNMIRKALPAIKKLDLKKAEDESEKDHRLRVGKDVMTVLLSECYEDTWKWLADIAEMDVKTFNQQPIGFAVEVIQEVSKSEDLKGFFKQAQALATVIKS